MGLLEKIGVRPPSVSSVSNEIKSLKSLMQYLSDSGKHNTTSYRLIKTSVSKLMDFEKLNSDHNKKK